MPLEFLQDFYGVPGWIWLVLIGLAVTAIVASWIRK